MQKHTRPAILTTRSGHSRTKAAMITRSQRLTGVGVERSRLHARYDRYRKMLLECLEANGEVSSLASRS